MKNKDFFSTLSGPILGLILMVLGLVLLLGAIFDWDWIFASGGMSGVWNLHWMDNFFGHKFARVVVGIAGVGLLLFGLFALLGIFKKTI